MARARSFPSDFLKDPDIIALAGADECLILIGLILEADDHGRGFAHSILLGREIRGYAPEQIENALHTLEQLELVMLYEVGRHRYYWLPRWNEWQKLREPAKSKFPAPPQKIVGSGQEVQSFLEKNEETLRNDENVQKPDQEGEGEEKEESEKEKEKEAEGTPDNVVPFPTNHTIGITAVSFSSEKRDEVTHQIASILRLGVNDALKRIVEEYCQDPTLSLFGEADAAREWVDDTRRNRKGQCMSPAFFRRWLKHEHDDVLKRQGATGTTGYAYHAPPSNGRAIQDVPSDDPYAAFLAQRIHEVSETSPSESGGTPL
ncbi:MAG: hypothetical protein NVSMB54_31060 [Ktedonobacteraceae bacterium]